MFEIGKSYNFMISIDGEIRNYFGYITHIELPLVTIDSAENGKKIINVHSSNFVSATRMDESDLDMPMPIIDDGM